MEGSLHRSCYVLVDSEFRYADTIEQLAAMMEDAPEAPVFALVRGLLCPLTDDELERMAEAL